VDNLSYECWKSVYSHPKIGDFDHLEMLVLNEMGNIHLMVLDVQGAIFYFDLLSDMGSIGFNF